MSAFGLGNLPVISIAGSLAGSQRCDVDRPRARGDAADARQAIDRAAVPLKNPSEISEAELSTDRDADGRMPYSPPEMVETHRESEESTAGDEAVGRRRRAADADGERGQRLDFDA